MKRLALAVLFSIFLGASTSLATGGDIPQNKIVVNVSPPENDWVSPAITAAGAVVVAGLGLWGISRSRRKGD